MKKIQIISLLLIIIMSSSLFVGCDMLMGTATAKKVHAKYEEIVEKYTVKLDSTTINQQESLFNANQNLIITYKDPSNFNTETNANYDSAFTVFHSSAGYAQTLYSVMSFFNQYRDSLDIDSNNWNADKIKAIYSSLLDFDKALNAFQIKKKAIENITIVYNDQNLTSPYSYTTMVIYNDFKKVYNNLIEKAISFVKFFERAYVEDVLFTDTFLTVSEVPYYEVRREAYTASLYLGEANYNYYVKHLGGFDAEDADLILFNSMVTIKTTIEDSNFLNSDFTSAENTSYYRLTRTNEQQVVAQSSFYTQAIKNANDLKDATSQSNINLYNDYLSAINSTTANYINYASFATELINKVQG